MKHFSTLAVLLTLLVIVVASASKECPLKKKSLNKKIKQYRAKCLKRGFQSSLGCESGDGNPKKKKMKKRCSKLEGVLKKCGYSCSASNGDWSEFGEWSECLVGCGAGIQVRMRTCTNPAPGKGGAECEGNSTESRTCHTIGFPTPVDGDWSEFGYWSECSAVCGGGINTRSRTCTSPAPGGGGAECEGNSTETRECNTKECPVKGGWSEYGEWSECSAQCDTGTQNRTRSCCNPAPTNGGANCVGDDEEFQTCNLQPCGEGWSETIFTETPSEDVYWHRSELAYKMGDNFQPSINMRWGSEPAYEGMILQGNLQFFLQNGTYIGSTNLFQTVTSGVHVASYREKEDWVCHNWNDEDRKWKSDNNADDAGMCNRLPGGLYIKRNNGEKPGCGTCWCCQDLSSGDQDFVIDVPGCGNQTFTKSVSHFNKTEGPTVRVTWNIASHAASSCPDLYGGLQFPTKEANVSNYFLLHYRISEWDSEDREDGAEGGVVFIPDSVEIDVSFSTGDTSDIGSVIQE